MQASRPVCKGFLKELPRLVTCVASSSSCNLRLLASPGISHVPPSLLRVIKEKLIEQITIDRPEKRAWTLLMMRRSTGVAEIHCPSLHVPSTKPLKPELTCVVPMQLRDHPTTHTSLLYRLNRV
jgi:hypothetical protein